MAAADAPEVATFASLPHVLALRIFVLLPADVRMRCAEVCPGWSTVLKDTSLWLRLDFSPASGVTQPVTDAMLLAAATRSGGSLVSLDATRCPRVTLHGLVQVNRLCAATLRELNIFGSLDTSSTAAANTRTASTCSGCCISCRSCTRSPPACTATTWRRRSSCCATRRLAAPMARCACVSCAPPLAWTWTTLPRWSWRRAWRRTRGCAASTSAGRRWIRPLCWTRLLTPRRSRSSRATSRTSACLRWRAWCAMAR